MHTLRQGQLLTFIKEYTKENDVCPSFEEMMIAMSLGSKSGIHRLITGLEERGLIERIPDRARAIRVVYDDDDSAKELEKMYDFIESKGLLQEYEQL